MNIKVSGDLLKYADMNESDFNLEVAIMLFKKNKLTLGQASILAGIHQFQFQKILAKRKIPIHYDKTALHKDLETLGIPY